MTAATPVQSMDNLEETKDEQTDPSPNVTATDTVTKPKEGDQSQTTTNSSPSKQSGNDMSPTKSRNRRKNDARRRSANFKKASSNTNQSEKQPSRPTTLETEPPDSTAKPLDEVTPGNQNSTDISIKHDDSGSNIREQNDINKDNTRDYKELKEQLKTQNSQILNLVDQVKQQISKITELEKALLRTNKTCNQLEKLLEQEILSRNNLEAESNSLGQTIARLKKQIAIHEKNRFNNDELVRVLNATLMERETEISILKLKLTRLQTNPSSTKALNSATSISSVKHEPSHTYAISGRSNSEFDRNSYIRSSLIAEAASVRASATHLKSDDQDASVWATVPEELTPSKRPALLDRSFNPAHNELYYNSSYASIQANPATNSFLPFERDRRYRTLPRSMKSPSQEFTDESNKSPVNENSLPEVKSSTAQPLNCRITNLDDSNSTSQSSGNRTINSYLTIESKQVIASNDIGSHHQTSNVKVVVDNSLQENSVQEKITLSNMGSANTLEESHYSVIGRANVSSSNKITQSATSNASIDPPRLNERTSTTPVKFSNKVKKLFDKFRRSDSTTNSASKTDINVTSGPKSSPFRRGANRSTMVASPNDIRSQMSPVRQVLSFQTDKPFAEWDTNMLCDWLTMIGLSMYSNQCRKWVECGANIMDATPAEVDKGLGITNHLHRKKLRLAISELNGDCDKITKAAAKLDYLWVARWLDDIGLPQYKETFINARVDGRVLNYLTVEDLLSMGVKSVLHHSSIRCGIKVLRSVQFDLQLLKRRATADEIEQMNSMRQNLNQVGDGLNKKVSGMPKEAITNNELEVPLWTCHRVMEWLRLIDFAEFAPNLRGSGVHGGLIMFEDGFNIDTMCSLLSIPTSRTLLRRHLSTFFKNLIGDDIADKKCRYQDTPSNSQMNPLAEIKSSKKSQLWFSKLKNPKVGQDAMDEYLCPMYPMEPQIIRSPKKDVYERRESQLPKISESINI